MALGAFSRFFHSTRGGVKRLLYWVCIWTILCFGILQLSKRQAAVTYLTNHVQRGLLQKTPQTDFQFNLIGETYKPNGFTPPLDPINLEPQVDRSNADENDQTMAGLAKIPNIPLEYSTLNNTQRAALSNQIRCARFPGVYDLEFNNMYWQRLNTRNGSTFYLYNAYYDDRWRGGTTASVRILGMVDRVQPEPTVCQLWFKPEKDQDGNPLKSPLFGQVTYIYGWIKQWGNYKDGPMQPFLISCRVPFKEAAGRVPIAVSLVERPCDKQTTNLRVIYDRPAVQAENPVSTLPTKTVPKLPKASNADVDIDYGKRGRFAVCVKGLDFLHQDLSVRLVEWLELLRLLGAEKVFLYELDVHPNISKVLRYYHDVEGLAQVTPLTLPGSQPNLPELRHIYLQAKLTNKRQNEVIPYNDCLYRNLYRYEYLALLDIDEVIMPISHNNWRELMVSVVEEAFKVQKYTRASYNFRNVYFLDDLQDGDELKHEAHEQGIPRYLHMLQHVYRSKNYTKPGSYVKCFHNTDRVLFSHNHFPLRCFGTCTTWSVNTSMAHMQHYRKDCVGPLKKMCSNYRAVTTRDTTIWKYKEALVQRTTQVLLKLGFFG